MATLPKVEEKTSQRNLAIQLILMLGLVSALGDITYESARSVSGPYLAFLGASATMVGLVTGLGEFLGYGLRLVTGYLADRTRSYWLATFVGYGLILCVPLLIFANSWELAALFLILERVGKAIRSPARDAILSHATHQTGRGWGFALHEALDQTGAVIGPLVFTAAFLLRNSYKDGFAILLLPAILTIILLGIARKRVPVPQALEIETTEVEDVKADGRKRLPRIFWIYVMFTFLSVAGFANFQIISFHFSVQAIIPLTYIPALYALAMGVDAIMALAVGQAYDRVGLISIGIIPFLTFPIPLLAFSTSFFLVVLSIMMWGMVMATHETIMRAAIADMIPLGRRGVAYGIFNTVYGASWFAGSALMGWLYDISWAYLILFVAAMQVLATLVFSVFTNSFPASINNKNEP